MTGTVATPVSDLLWKRFRPCPTGFPAYSVLRQKPPPAVSWFPPLGCLPAQPLDAAHPQNQPVSRPTSQANRLPHSWFFLGLKRPPAAGHGAFHRNRNQRGRILF